MAPQNGRSGTKRLVSYDVFMRHITYDDNGNIDVSGIFSKACFNEWIENRKKHPKDAEESYRKALVAHVSGKDDRKPFPEEVESGILKRLRESTPWPCFADSPNGASKIGERGLKKSSLGFHEAKKRSQMEGNRMQRYMLGPFTNTQPFQETICAMPRPVTSLSNSTSQTHMSDFDSSFTLLLKKIVDLKMIKRNEVTSFSQTFLCNISDFYTLPELRDLYSCLYNKGYHLFTEELAWRVDSSRLLELPTYKNSFIHCPRSVCEETDQQGTSHSSFNRIGCLTLSINGTVLSAEPSVSAFFRRGIVDSHFYDLLEKPEYRMVVHNAMLHALLNAKTNICCIRILCLSHVLLLKMKIDEARIFRICMIKSAEVFGQMLTI